MMLYGLTGYPLGHSFSQRWFTERFRKAGITDAEYRNFPLDDIKKLPELLTDACLLGLNITAPYKTAAMAYVEEIDPVAEEIGAINCIVRSGNGWKGYNTDWIGFKESLKIFLDGRRPAALILGSGGASRAAVYAMRKISLPYIVVTRNPKDRETIGYEEITPEILSRYKLIVNATPLGTFPNIGTRPPIPYHLLSGDHLLYDMVYNPPLTSFLREGKIMGCGIENGAGMLKLQAEETWRLFFDTTDRKPLTHCG